MTRDGTAGSKPRRGASGCVARGTLVETASGARAVEQLRIGDQVWGYDLDRREPVVTRVTTADPIKATETLTVGKLRVTADHPIFVQGEWKPAGKLKPTDLLLTSNLKEQPAGQVEVIPGEVHVYDIAVDPPQNFFAGGLLVHNKA